MKLNALSVLAILVHCSLLHAAPVHESRSLERRVKSATIVQGMEDAANAVGGVIDNAIKHLSDPTSRYHGVWEFHNAVTKKFAQDVDQVFPAGKVAAVGSQKAEQMGQALSGAGTGAGGLADEVATGAARVSQNMQEGVKVVKDKAKSVYGSLKNHLSGGADDAVNAAGTGNTATWWDKAKQPAANAFGTAAGAAANDAVERVGGKVGKKITNKLIAAGLVGGGAGVVGGAVAEKELDDDDDDSTEADGSTSTGSTGSAAAGAAAGAGAAAANSNDYPSAATIADQVKNLKADPLTPEDKQFLNSYIKEQYNLNKISAAQRDTLLAAVKAAPSLPSTQTTTTPKSNKPKMTQVQHEANVDDMSTMEDSQVDDMADDLSNIQLTPAQQAAYQAALDSNPYITDGQRARLLNIITGAVTPMSDEDVEKVVDLIERSTLNCNDISYFELQVQRQYASGTLDQDQLDDIVQAYEDAETRCSTK